MSEYSYTTKLFFEDECPQIGSGWRTVIVDDDIDITVITDCIGNKCRLSTNEFDSLVEASERRIIRCSP